MKEVLFGLLSKIIRAPLLFVGVVVKYGDFAKFHDFAKSDDFAKFHDDDVAESRDLAKFHDDVAESHISPNFTTSPNLAIRQISRLRQIWRFR